MRHYRLDKLRKKLEKNESWLRSYVRHLSEEEKAWNHFEIFECSEFFVGYETAAINREVYKKAIKALSRKFNNAGDVCNRLYSKRLSDLY